MRTIRTTAGTAIELDGDVLAVLETISRDLRRAKGLDYDYEDVEREFQHVVGQLTEDELRTYVRECLVMSFNRYENELMAAVIRRAQGTKPDEER